MVTSNCHSVPSMFVDFDVDAETVFGHPVYAAVVFPDLNCFGCCSRLDRLVVVVGQNASEGSRYQIFIRLGQDTRSGRSMKLFIQGACLL